MASTPLDQEVAELAARISTSFTDTDWKVLAQRIGFRKQVAEHPRLLRSLAWNDPDYPGHVLDMLNRMVDADPANLGIIRAIAQRDDTSFFEDPGRYRTRERIGAGGYGEVFRETDTLLDIEFARKDLLPSPFVTDEVIGRFLREARILFRLSHPNIIAVRNVGRHGPNAYIRMDYFPGSRLGSEGAVAPPVARAVATQIASAMSHAHSRGVIHRDLKPSNVLVMDSDVRIIDFGLGAFVEAEPNMQLTRSNQNLAGGSFAAPELKENPKLRDPKLDIFSIGALWFHLVTGRDPSHVGFTDMLDTVADLSPADRDLIVRCMSIAEKRPADGSELVDAMTDTPQSASIVVNLPMTQDELSGYEIRLMAAFARARPSSGDVVGAEALRHHALAVNLHDDLLYGLAVTALETRGYITRNESGDIWWALTDAGRKWLATNVATLIQLREDDLAEERNRLVDY